MKIGLTYDLRDDYLSAGFDLEETAEFDQPGTIDALHAALSELGHEVERIGHAQRLVRSLAAGSRWDLVFNIAEGLAGAGREAQVPAILDVFGIPYTFSDPLVLALTLDKGLTKVILRSVGIPTAPSITVRSARDLETINLPLPLFAKPIAEGTGKGISISSKVTQITELAPVCERLLRQFQQPVLVETFLPGREFTVGIVGTDQQARVLGTLEIHLRAGAEPEVYSYANKDESDTRVDYTLVRPDDDREVAEAERIALAAWRILGCRDAGRVDVRSDADGQPQFMEVNPLAGLHPSHSDLPFLCTMLGMSYAELIGQIVASASVRCATSRRFDLP